MIENNAARPLQKPAMVLMMRKINDSRYAEPARLQLFDDIPEPFGSSARRHHGVQNNRSVVVKRHPVIREDGIGSVKFFLILHYDHFDTRIFQPAFENIELHTGTTFDLLTVRICNFSLKQE